MDDCLFCRIAQKKQTADIVYETERVVAFRDIFPKAPVHLLVIPKEHVSSIMELDPTRTDLIVELLSGIQNVVRQQKIDGSGFRLVSNTGKDSGQMVAHLHYHILAGGSLKGVSV